MSFGFRLVYAETNHKILLLETMFERSINLSSKLSSLSFCETKQLLGVSNIIKFQNLCFSTKVDMKHGRIIPFQDRQLGKA